MLRKAYTPVRLFVEAILYLVAGIFLFVRPAETLDLGVRLAKWLMLGGAAFILAEAVLHREKRVDWLEGVLLALGGGLLAWWPEAAGVSVSVIFGLWMALNALCKLLYAAQLHHDRQRGWAGNLIMGIVHALFAVALLTAPLAAVLPLTVMMGIYCLVYGLFALGDGFRELLGTDVKGRSVRQRIRISPPVLLTALIPQWLLRMLSDPNEDVETAKWTRRETNDETAQRDLEIFLHLSKDTAMGMGHVDIALGNTVYSYGCYDESSNRLFGLISDGVLVTADRDKYIPFCLGYEKKKLISFGVSLDERQREQVKAAADRFMEESTLWTPPEGSMQAAFAEQADAVFHKVHKGPFKTYNALKTNCVALADILCGASGLDLMAQQGIVTPGTYYVFLDRQFLRRNSIVISRTVYR